MKTPRDFSARSPVEQQIFTEDTWCDVCEAPDLGMRDPREFEEDGKIIVEGYCRRCGSGIRSQIVERGPAQPKGQHGD